MQRSKININNLIIEYIKISIKNKISKIADICGWIFHFNFIFENKFKSKCNNLNNIVNALNYFFNSYTTVFYLYIKISLNR